MTDLTISASQIDSFLLCPRQWWFKRVLRLPEVQKSYFTFGTVLHAVIERWLKADSNGRGPDGAAVDPFPEGWETVEEKGQKVSVTPNEARLIRALFEEAIERGIIVRDPRIQVEREIKLPVLENVELIGYVDLFKPSDKLLGTTEPPICVTLPEIHDHKTFSESSVRYLKQPGPDGPINAPYAKGDGTSPNCVGHTQQMLTYAAATSYEDAYRGSVLVRHNQFPKFEDPKGVRKVEALLSHDRLALHWAFLQDTARDMLRVKEIKEWTDTPGPNEDDACSRFGGCPFVPICGRQENPTSYKIRVEKVLTTANGRPKLNLPTTPRKRKTGNETNVEIFARAKAQHAARSATPEAVAEPRKATPARTVPSPINSAPPQETATTTVAAVAASDGAPWADPECPVQTCRGLGVNSKGRACPICDKTAEKRNKPSSAMYILEMTDGGTILASVRPQHTGKVTEMGSPLTWDGSKPKAEPAKPLCVSEGESVIEPKPEPKPQPKPTPQPTPNLVLEPDPEPEPKPLQVWINGLPQEIPENNQPMVKVLKENAKPIKDLTTSKGGRPRVGCTILLGVAQIKGAERPVTTAQEVLERVGAELAKDMGAESYWMLDPFKRRERLRQKAEVICDGLGRAIVLVPGGTNDPDLMSLVNGLIPHAEFVYEALR